VRGRTARARSLTLQRDSWSQADPERSGSSAAELDPRADDSAVATAVLDGEHAVTAGKQLAPPRNGKDDAWRGRECDRDAVRQLLGDVAPVRETELESSRGAAAAYDERPEHDTPADAARRAHGDAHRKAQANPHATAVEWIGREDHGRVVIAGLRAPRNAYADVDDP
jgi:hypothetical protein